MSVRVINGDCRDVLKTLDADSFDCVVSSPPYWGLRDYGTAKWEGGDPECDHRSPTMREGRNEDRAKLAGSASTNSGQLLLAANSACGKCGARRVDSQIGLEPTLDAYVETMVGVFSELRRVLKPQGTFWLNLGDSYNAHPGQRKTTDKVGAKQMTNGGSNSAPSRHIESLKPKDLCGVPWRVAFALQADGWWLRSAIVWQKPNPMPESVTDRPTSAYEMVFLLTKAERYFYDADAIGEEFTAPPKKPGGFAPEKAIGPMARGGHSQWENRRTVEASYPNATRNARNVWTIATQPFKGSHFATMPPDLAERCIKAGCPRGGHVLDPFGGAGTTGLVADRLGRHATLIELNPAYRDMAANRVFDDAPLFSQAAE